jgi:U2 small nuclear ribonucleoprotein B''
MPTAAAGEVTATELQQSIFNAPPSAAPTTLPSPAAGSLKPPIGDRDYAMEDAKSPTTSVAGQKRSRDEEEDEAEEDSEGDVAMDEDSDDE